MSSYKKEILSILELKNEQSFYQKQKQGKKIIKFLKSIPMNQLEEFNIIGSHSVAEVSIELMFAASMKYIDIINFLYEREKNNNYDEALLDNQSQNLKVYLFAYLIQELLLESIFPKTYEDNKKIDYKDIEQEVDVFNIFKNYNINEIKNNIFKYIYDFDISAFDRENHRQIQDVIKAINSLEIYDFIFIINNFLHDHIPLISMYEYFDKNQIKMLLEYTLDIQNSPTTAIIFGMELGFKKYKKLKSESDNINILNELYLKNLKGKEDYREDMFKIFDLRKKILNQL